MITCSICHCFVPGKEMHYGCYDINKKNYICGRCIVKNDLDQKFPETESFDKKQQPVNTPQSQNLFVGLFLATLGITMIIYLWFPGKKGLTAFSVVMCILGYYILSKSKGD